MIAVGVIEIVGGALLISGRLLRPTALVLAGDMIGAIVVSGVSNGEIISLTLAPALLVAMIVQLLAELGPPCSASGHTDAEETPELRYGEREREPRYSCPAAMQGTLERNLARALRGATQPRLPSRGSGVGSASSSSGSRSRSRWIDWPSQ